VTFHGLEKSGKKFHDFQGSIATIILRYFQFQRQSEVLFSAIEKALLWNGNAEIAMALPPLGARRSVRLNTRGIPKCITHPREELTTTPLNTSTIPVS
jgi:hypothetical protein